MEDGQKIVALIVVIVGVSIGISFLANPDLGNDIQIFLSNPAAVITESGTDYNQVNSAGNQSVDTKNPNTKDYNERGIPGRDSGSENSSVQNKITSEKINDSDEGDFKLCPFECCESGLFEEKNCPVSKVCQGNACVDQPPS